ncbi:MAG: ABC transporter ATP-binding protein [Thermodesulfobacteriota bacterium]
MERNKIIETDGLTKRYGRIVAVEGLSLSVSQGEIFGFLGPNGAGKTTTILMLLGLTRPTKGKASVYGLDPAREATKVKRVVGYLPEHLGFYDDLSARENLKYVARLNRIPDSVSEERIEKALDTVGLVSDSKRRVSTFSRGMRQRLGIAEILIKEPRLVILDEPTLGLDPEASNRMIELIQKLSKDRGMTVLFSSHFLQQVQKISDKIGIMIRGKMVAQGAIDDLAKEKLGVEQEKYSLEELYMKYFREG